MTLGNQILMFQERNVKCFYINTPRLTKDQRVSICLEYPRVNNAREVIPAALGRSLTTNVYFLTIVRLSTGYCCIRYLIGRFWLILDTFKNGYSSLNAAHSVNIARKCTGRISKSKLDNTECQGSNFIAAIAAIAVEGEQNAVDHCGNDGNFLPYSAIFILFTVHYYFDT